jgi:hypothetical protein
MDILMTRVNGKNAGRHASEEVLDADVAGRDDRDRISDEKNDEDDRDDHDARDAASRRGRRHDFEELRHEFPPLERGGSYQE